MTGDEHLSDDRRLFGVPYAEDLHDNPAAVYELQIEPYTDGHDRRPVVVEEWTVYPPKHHLRRAADIVDWLLECAAEDGEVTEGWSEAIDRHDRDPDVLAAAEALLDVLASKVRYRMADRKVAEHTITWGADDEPLLDGRPLYVKAAAPTG